MEWWLQRSELQRLHQGPRRRVDLQRVRDRSDDDDHDPPDNDHDDPPDDDHHDAPDDHDHHDAPDDHDHHDAPDNDHHDAPDDHDHHDWGRRDDNAADGNESECSRRQSVRPTVSGGYWIAHSNGAVDAQGGVPELGGLQGPRLNAPSRTS